MRLPLRSVCLLALVFFLGAALSTVAFFVVRKQEAVIIESEFAGFANERFFRLERSIESALEGPHAIAGLLGTSGKITRTTFKRITKHFISPTGSAQAFEWIPRVSDSQRESYEAAARGEGYPGFQITEMKSRGEMVRAGTRPVYYPVYYMEPTRGNMAALGFDLGSEPARLAALNKARTTRKIVASERIPLVQEMQDQYGFLVIFPVYQSGGISRTLESRNEVLKGFVLGVLRAEKIVRQSLPETADPDRAVKVYVFDVSAPPGRQLLFPKGATTNSKDDLNLSASLSRIIPVADRKWEVIIVPGAGSFGHGLGRLPWAVLLGGLLYTAGLSVVLLVSLTQSIRTRNSEDKFRNSEMLLRAAFDAIPLWVYVKDSAGRYIMVNRKMAEEKGSTPAYFAGLPVENSPSIQPDQLAKTLQTDQSILTSGGMEEYFQTMDLADGRQRRFRIFKGPLFDENGQITGIVGIAEDVTDSERAAAALHASETLLQTVFDTSPVAISVKDREARYIMVNRAFSQLFGVDSGAAIGRTFAELGLGSRILMERVTHEDRQLLATGEEVAPTAVEWTGADGERYWLHTVKAPIRQKSGEITGLVAIVGDITESIRAKEALSEIEERFTSVMEHTPAMVFLKDLEGRYRLVNRRYAEWLGISADEALGKTSYDLYPEDLARRFDDDDRQILESGETREREITFPFTRQGTQTLMVTKFPVRDPAGRAAGVGAICMDITNRKRMERESHENEEKFRNLIEGSIQGIWVHREFELLFANQALADIFGYETPKEMLAVGLVLNMISPKDRRLVRERAIARMQGKPVENQYEFRALRKDGSQIWVHTIVQNVIWEGRPATQATFIDVTSRKDAEDRIRQMIVQLEESQLQLVQSDKMAALGQMAAGVAHEINNPLASISSSAQFLSHYLESGGPEKFAGETVQKHLKKIDDNIFRSKAIIQNVLNFSRSEEPHMAKVDVRELVRESIDLAKDLPHAHERVFDLKIEESGGAKGAQARRFTLHTLPRQIQQVVSNLLANAVQATPAGGKVTTTITPLIGHIEIAVSDNGVGIPEEHLEKIFQPLFTTKPPGLGTGLGLSLSRQIIVSLGGQIEVESQVGAGTTMRLILPTTRRPLLIAEPAASAR